MDLPLSPVKKILKRTRLKVSDDAVKEFTTLLEEIIADISAEAVAIAKSNGRKTVIVKDVRAAKRKIV
ncbi:NFYB/HAP3 family transcription factor subunit [Candidatus Woesearchaeota archaeon]|nr:NFYB/HAP3 family transcription factor subunit [Candidatus Woesearchaeota archaeon]